jgi:hypothetical protein
MNTILWVFLAFAAGLMLFVSIQDDIPDELSFLKNKSGVVQHNSTTVAPTVTQYGGWTVRQAGAVVEMTRRLSGRIEVNGTAYDTPEIGILCNNGMLDLRLDTRMPTTGTRTTPVGISGLSVAEWDKSATKNIFPKEPRPVLQALLSQKSVAVTVSYASLGRFTTQLDTSELPQLVASLPQNCR